MNLHSMRRKTAKQDGKTRWNKKKKMEEKFQDLKYFLGKRLMMKDKISPIMESKMHEMSILKSESSKAIVSKVGKVSFDLFPDSQESLGIGKSCKFESETERKKWEDKMFRVKPFGTYPMLMSEKDLHTEKLKPSVHVLNLKSSLCQKSTPNTEVKCSSCKEIYKRCRIAGENDGRIGSFLVEVLGCVGLPKLDRFSKPNTEVYLICGDSRFRTDVLHSCRSPIWPCRSHRAALFPIFHAYARLYVGVFNQEEKKKTKTANDRFIGRVVVDLAMLRPNTIYDVTLPLRDSVNVYNTRPRGVIRLRFHLHWCNEAIAVSSYLQIPFQNEGRLPLPCEDAKIFRNTALTIYGENLPGHYSPKSFRATTREFMLYENQLKFLVVSQFLSLICWENPFMSGYIFASWMILTYYGIISFIPSFTSGLVVIILANNYKTFVLDNKFHFGYSSLTLWEISLSFLFGSNLVSADGVMKPISVHKLVTPKVRYTYEGGSIQSIQSNFDVRDDENMNHTVFPFSEKNTYKRRTISGSLFPSRSLLGEKDNDKLSDSQLNRLSIYQKSIKPNSVQLEGKTTNIDSNESDDDWSESDEEPSEEEDLLSPSLVTLALNQMPAGPEQNADIRTKSTPFKVALNKFEKRVHNASLHIGKEEITDNSYSFDEFDRLLGLKLTPSNPVTRLKAEYTGPVMRVLNVANVIMRILVNVFTWKDPILTFWVLLAFLLLSLILAVLPWQKLSALLGFILFGPQNIFLKKSLIRKLQSVEKEKEMHKEVSSTADIEENSEILFGFKATQKEKNKCRSVYIPYTPLRKERFYDWPPNPKVSRAIPCRFSEKVDFTNKDDQLMQLQESLLEYADGS